MLSIIIDSASGRQLRCSRDTKLDVLDGKTEALVEIADLDAEPDPAAFVWDPTTRAYVAVVVPAPAPLTKVPQREVRTRLGRETRIAINTILEGTDPADAALRATLRDAKDVLDAADLDIEHPDAIASVQALVDAGLKVARDVTDILRPVEAVAIAIDVAAVGVKG